MVKPNLAPKTQVAEFMIFSGFMLLVLTTIVLALFLNRLNIREESETAPTRRIQDLVSLLKQAESKRSMLESEVSRLRKKMVGMENHSGKTSQGGVAIEDPELQKLYRMAGLTPTEGPGIVIALEDSKKPQQPKDAHADPNSGKLQADDLLKLINELKAAGATAISINDQRLIVTSEIVSAGPAISVNQTRLSQPVTVKSTGDPDVLMNALRIRGGILEYLEFFDINVSVKTDNHVVIPAYKGSLSN